LARAEIAAGICGFTTRVEARGIGGSCTLTVESDCEAIKRLAAELTEVDPFREITYRGAGPVVLELAASFCRHPACPVPVGILKAVEVEAGLALPADAVIRLTAGHEDG
jgi:hypothetical protein